MKKFLITSFAALALAFSLHAPAAFAEVTGTPQEGQACATDFHQPAVLDGIMQGGTCVARSAYTSQSAAAAANTPTDYSKSGDAQDSMLNSIMGKVASLFAWLVGVAAITLDNAVYYTVVNMGSYIHQLTAIGVTWRILRDIGNILLIFGFLMIGIEVILSIEKLGERKTLVMLLVAAVFMNFSLFFAEAVIDTGNLFATQFYTQINGGKPAGAKTFDPGSFATSNEGISNKLLAQLGLTTMYGNALNNKNVLQGNNPWYIGFMGILLFIVTAFVMFSLAFILIARFIYLVFLIILAPVGFAGKAIPQMTKLSDWWWGKLFEQTITAPVLLLLLYIALSVITDANFLTGVGGGKAGAATGFVGNTDLPAFAGYILSFVVAMGLMLAVTMLAKGLAASGADKATSWAGKLTFGATAFGMRYTAGIGSNLVARKVRENKALNSSGLGRATGRRIAAVFDYGATANYHAGNALNTVMPGPGVNYGDTHKGGYRAEEKAVKEYKTSTETAQSEVDKKKRIAELNDKRKNAETAINAEKLKLADGRITQAQYDANVAPHNTAIAEVLSKMSTKEIADLDGIKKGTEALVKNLSPQQFEALMKSDSLDEASKVKVRDARFKDVKDQVKKAADLAVVPPGETPAEQTDREDRKLAAEKQARETLSKLSVKEIVHMDKSALTSNFVADNMTDAQFDAVTKEGVLNVVQTDALNTRRKGRFIPSASNSADDVAKAIRSLEWDPDKLKKLTADTLTDSDVLNALGDDAITLIEYARVERLPESERTKLRTYFMGIMSNPADPRAAVFTANFAGRPRLKSTLLIP